MAEMLGEHNQSVRVVMFGSGPELTYDARQFLVRLEAHPEIELVGAFCQAAAQSLGAVIDDLWRRRGILAVPLLLAREYTRLLRFLQNPKVQIEQRHIMDSLAGRIHWVEDIHTQEVLDQVSALKPDLGLIYGSPILKEKLFGIPRLGTLGIHHGMLPEYRGNKTTFWAMYNGEHYAGVTIQKINAGLDTGSIVKEGRILIGKRSYSQVVRQLEALGLDLYLQAILEVKFDTAEFKPQPASKGKLYRNPKPVDFLRFWLRRAKARIGQRNEGSKL